MNVLLEMWHAIAMLYVPTQLDPSHASAILVSLEMVKHAEVINTRIMCCVGIELVNRNQVVLYACTPSEQRLYYWMLCRW